MVLARAGSALSARIFAATSSARSGSAATPHPMRTASEATSLSAGATATMGRPAAQIPYILLGTTTPSSPRRMVMICASPAARTDGILLAGKNGRKRTFWHPAAAVSISARCAPSPTRSEEHTSELQSRSDLVCRLLLEKKKDNYELYPTNKERSLGV